MGKILNCKVLLMYSFEYSLLCYYCPLQQKSKPCPQTTSQCMPDQRCAISTGNYGFFHILSSQGCVDSKLCGSHKVISYQGVKYNVSYTCCCKNQCNILPKSDTLVTVRFIWNLCDLVSNHL
uniref:UPAR/Ly6 domain-containing protein n=1 Tax=Pundamilia nyererei TaxID=303518 RepID=A0A3B4H7C2_9CICH